MALLADATEPPRNAVSAYSYVSSCWQDSMRFRWLQGDLSLKQQVSPPLEQASLDSDRVKIQGQVQPSEKGY